MLRRSFLPLLILAALLAPQRGAHADPTEYDVKAVFLLNFARYVDWPADKLGRDDAVRLCIVGRDPFGAAMQSVDGKQVQGRVLRVSRVSRPAEAAGCHLAFLSASEEERLAATLRMLAGKAILTVSDVEGFAAAGGAIEFATVDDRIRFDVNLRTVRRGGLHVSSHLMRIARQVLGLGEGN